MENSVSSNFDCDPEIMLKWLQHHSNLHQISPQKKLKSTFFKKKKKKFRPTSQKGRFPILTRNLKPLSGMENFFFFKFNLLVQFFGVKFTGNYHVVGIIT